MPKKRSDSTSSSSDDEHHKKKTQYNNPTFSSDENPPPYYQQSSAYGAPPHGTVVTNQPGVAGQYHGQPHGHVVITTQPGSIVIPGQIPQGIPMMVFNNQIITWARGSIPNCPPGLEHLLELDHLTVQHTVEIVEALTLWETRNRYKIKNGYGHQFLAAKEISGCCNRWCCGPIRSLDMKILDHTKTEVMHLFRPFRCVACCYYCCLQEMEVYAPPGTLIGTVHQEWSICTPKFTIRDEADNVVLRITGPCCQSNCCSDIHFPVLSKDGTRDVGMISKKFRGVAREFLTDADHFGISFPKDLDVKMKAVCLGALFLIDFIYFET